MRAKPLAVAAAAVAVVIAGVAIGFAVWPDDDSSSDTSSTASVTEAGGTTTTTTTGRRAVTIRVLATVTSARPVDLPPRNVQNKGDRVFVESQLRNAVPQFGRPKGSIVGVDYSTITFLSERERLVNVQITLPGGGLRLRGTIHVSEPDAVVRIPVIGGTRDFQGARGVSEARDAPGNQTLNVYRLQLP